MEDDAHSLQAAFEHIVMVDLEVDVATLITRNSIIIHNVVDLVVGDDESWWGSKPFIRLLHSSYFCCLFTRRPRRPKKQPIMPIEDRLFDRGLMRSAMASRKSRNIYISKCFMVVRNCIHIFVLC